MVRLASLFLALGALTACFEIHITPCDDPADPPTAPVDTGDIGACLLPGDPGVISHMPLETCFASLVGCDAGGEYFEDDCGCGCYAPPEEDCLLEDDPGVTFWLDAQSCQVALVHCEVGEEYFGDSCGCGCYQVDL